MNVEQSPYNNEIYDDSKLEDLTEPLYLDDDVDLEDLESLRIEKKSVIYQNEKPYTFDKSQDRADVFIKNYLMKFDMHRSLRVLEQELFELLSKGEINVDSLPIVPFVYIESEKLQEEIGIIQRDLDDAKIYAEKAKSLFNKLNKEKENQKIKHRRSLQEKQMLIKDINNLKKLYENDETVYKDLKKRYWNITKESLLIEQDLKAAKTRAENAKDNLERAKKNYEEIKKQVDRNFF
jgi:hypothetical protein